MKLNNFLLSFIYNINKYIIESLWISLYFDSDDYSSPLKINVNDALRFHLLNGYTKNVNLRVRRNDVSDQKSPYFIDPSDSYSFFSVGDVSQDTSAFSYNCKIQTGIFIKINDTLKYFYG